MPILTLSKIDKSFGQRVLFDKLEFEIERGERVGLIGDNGAGKTTLLRLITQEDKPELGIVAIPKSVRVGYLAQDPVFDPANTVMDEAELAFADLHRLAHQLRDLEHAMAEQEGDALEKTLAKYQDAQHEFDLGGGYAWQHKLEATLLGVGLDRKYWEQEVGTLSGGQRSRLALAKLLVAAPDLLLLDEPTNHLDLVAIEWLEKYLLEFTGAVLLISHDRYLLDRLATRIVWLTRQKLQSYPGNYSSFVVQRALAEKSQQRAFEEQQADIAKQQEFIRRFGAGQRSKEAKGREKRLNRLLISEDIVRAVDTQKSIALKMDIDRRAGDRVLTVRGLSKSFGDNRLWIDVNFDVKRGERIGIIGPNGSGKTTMLRSLLGQEQVDSGDVRWGASLQLGYYDQRLDEFDPENTIFEEVRLDRPDVKDQTLRETLATMLFRGDDIEKPMSALSGGERARVALVELLLDKPNVILLDEPTNHLDIPSREALESALASFPGTILCVSHDRFFLEQTVERLLVIDPPDVANFEGTYHEWAAKRSAPAPKPVKNSAPVKKEEEKSKSHGKSKAKSSNGDREKNKDNPYARPHGRLSLAELERQIAESEVAIGEFQQQFAQVGARKDPKRGRQLQGEYDALAKNLESLEAEYLRRAANDE